MTKYKKGGDSATLFHFDCLYLDATKLHITTDSRQMWKHQNDRVNYRMPYL